MIKPKRPKPWIVICGSIFIIVLWGLYSQFSGKSSRQKRSYFFADLYNQAAVCVAFSGVHDYSGRMFYSLEELEKSSYYPFKQSYPTCHGGQIYIHFNSSTNASTLDGYIGLKGLKADQNLHLHTKRPFSYTHNLTAVNYQTMQTYCAGVQERIKQINKIRSAFLLEHKHAEQMCQTSHPWTIKPIPQSSISGNMPRTGAEQQNYGEWIRETEGVNQLQDSWHHELIFSLAGKQIVCISRGPDGVLKSADDIVVRSN